MGHSNYTPEEAREYERVYRPGYYADPKHGERRRTRRRKLARKNARPRLKEQSESRAWLRTRARNDLQWLRDTARFTYADTARLLGCTADQVSNWTRGKQSVKAHARCWSIHSLRFAVEMADRAHDGEERNP